MDEIAKFIDQIHVLAEKHPEYKQEVYQFVMSGLHHTLGKMKEHRHVTGQELSCGIRDYALDQFGPLARTVLEYWGIRSTLDFGHIVYYMIEAGLMTKTEEDSLNDFKEVFTFDEAFHNKVIYDL